MMVFGVVCGFVALWFCFASFFPLSVFLFELLYICAPPSLSPSLFYLFLLFVGLLVCFCHLF